MHAVLYSVQNLLLDCSDGKMEDEMEGSCSAYEERRGVYSFDGETRG
jgi:hypothetical protein